MKKEIEYIPLNPFEHPRPRWVELLALSVPLLCILGAILHFWVVPMLVPEPVEASEPIRDNGWYCDHLEDYINRDDQRLIEYCHD